jgi:hypothetical protein
MLSVLMIVAHALALALFYTTVAGWLTWLRRTLSTRGGRRGL